MASLFYDSFDHYTTAQATQKWTQLSEHTANYSIVSAAGARGTYGLRLTSGASNTQNSAAISKTLSPASATVIVGANFQSSTFSGLGGNLIGGQAAHALYSIIDVGDYQIRLRPQVDGTLAVYKGGAADYSGSTLLGASTLAMQTGVQYYVWLKVLLHASAGTVLVMVNGDSWLSLSGIATKVTSNTTYFWNVITLGPISGGSSDTFDYDDLAIIDGSGSTVNDIPCSYLRIDALYPSADGAHTQFTKLSGASNYLMVNEGSVSGGTGNDADTTYNETSTVTNQDSYVFPALPITSSTVISVQRNMVARAPSGGASSLAGSYRTSGVDYPASGTGLTTSYSDYREVLDTNPGTSVAWLATDIPTPNQHGFKKTA